MLGEGAFQGLNHLDKRIGRLWYEIDVRLGLVFEPTDRTESERESCEPLEHVASFADAAGRQNAVVDERIDQRYMSRHPLGAVAGVNTPEEANNGLGFRNRDHDASRCHAKHPRQSALEWASVLSWVG